MTEKNKLFSIIDGFRNCKVLVVGDIILDEYIWGKANRLSPEAPVPVLEVSKYSHVPGGAANVANNIKSLGGNVAIAGVLGKDTQADQLENVMKEQGIDTSCLVRDESRPTTVKTRLLAHNRQQLVRFDRETKEPISSSTESELTRKVSDYAAKVDLILLSDYAKGVLTETFLQRAISFAKELNKPVLVDPKGLDFKKYCGATLITPNRLEAEVATKSEQGTEPEKLAQKIRQQLNVEHVLVTLGEDGILISSGDKLKRIPAVTSEVYDVTGAGDSLISAIALAMVVPGADLETAVEIGNYTAGVAVRKIGTTAVTPAELKDLIESHLMHRTIGV
jgi:rfaE bifunctional protein kinase chain/domain